MSTVCIDTEGKFCVVVFPLPQRPPESIRYIVGRIVVSCQEGIPAGAAVLAAGTAVQYILDKRHDDETLFQADLVENTGKHTDGDPDWFAKYVCMPETEGSDMEPVVKLVESARMTLRSALDKLDKRK